MDSVSLEGVVGEKPSCGSGVIACSCFLFRGVRWGAILGSLLASWKCRHVRMTGRRAAEAAALHCRHDVSESGQRRWDRERGRVKAQSQHAAHESSGGVNANMAPTMID
jgi:hypothetical protein